MKRCKWNAKEIRETEIRVKEILRTLTRTKKLFQELLIAKELGIEISGSQKKKCRDILKAINAICPESPSIEEKDEKNTPARRYNTLHYSQLRQANEEFDRVLKRWEAIAEAEAEA